MAYRILYGKEILWDPYSDTADAIIDASMSVNANAAKYLDFAIPPTHHLYNVVSERSENVWLYSDNKIIYKGFISKITLDMEGYKSISCTSVMDYLGDTHVRDYSTVKGEQPLTAPTSLDGLFQWYIDQHNKHCIDSRKRFKVGVNQAGALDENNYVYRSSTQFPTTADEISEKILDSGGYIFERYDGGTNVLDFYADAHEANAQILDFGVNITDFTQERSVEDQYTAVYATGYTPDPPKNNPDKEMKPISLADIQNGGSPYNSDYTKLGDVLYSISGVQRYGYREYHYSNNDITTTSYLLKMAGVVLTKLLAPTITLDVKAVDLALFMNNGYEHLQLGQAVRVRSKPHGIDEYLMISGIDLDLQDPGNTSYTIGATYDTLTGQQSSYLKSLNSGINSSLDAVGKLDSQTKKNALNTEEAQRRADEADKKAEQAKTDAAAADAKADKASQDATVAGEKAEQAKTDAAAAIGSAKDAADKAADAAQKADDNTAKIAVVENTIKTISGDTAAAVANAKAAKDAADAANKAAEQAKADASTANTEIGKVQSQVGTINTEISNIKQEATDLRDDLSGQITTVKNTMEADYTRKTELSETTATLRNEISASAAGVIQTVSQDYATKKELKTTTDATNKNAADLTNAIKKFNSDVDNLQGQIDGAIETWFYEVDPTDENEPTVNWTTDTLKKVHLGDLYYNTVSGYCWRYQLQNGTYSWSRITDVDVTKALKDAAAAQTTANSKKRVFVTTPTPPYEVGDLWVQGSTGDIMRCQTAKTSSQSYAVADWVKASKYTDDSAVTKLSNTVEKTYSTKTEVKQLSDQVSSTVSSLETVRVSAEAAQTSADNAKKAADAAQSAADTAKSNAATAQSKADEAAKNLATAQQNLKTLQSQANATDEQLTAAKAEVEKAKTAAASAQSTANTAKSNATTAQATADTAKANAKTAQDDVNALKNRVTSAETSIKQNSDAIALRATKTEVTSAIDGISVGGRNLILKSKRNETSSNYGFASSYSSEKITPGETYTLSYNGSTKAGSTGRLVVYINTASWGWQVRIDHAPSNEPKTYSKTFTYPADCTQETVYISSYLYPKGSTGECTLNWYKLEKGNKATDWSPAPEDLQDDATTKANNALASAKTYADAQIKVSADSIKSEVSSVKSTADSALSKATSVEQTANGLTTKITAAQSTADTAKANAKTAQDTANAAQSTANTAKNTADAAKSTAATASSNASSALTKATTAASDASTAKTDAATAKSTANTANSTANSANSTANAAKTATNTLETLIRQSGDGVEVAKKVNGKYTSTKTLMGSDGFYIKDSAGTNLTQVKSDSAIIGKESATHMHVNSDSVNVVGKDENVVANFYERGLILNSGLFNIYSTDFNGDATLKSNRIYTKTHFSLDAELDDKNKVTARPNLNRSYASGLSQISTNGSDVYSNTTAQLVAQSSFSGTSIGNVNTAGMFLYSQSHKDSSKDSTSIALSANTISLYGTPIVDFIQKEGTSGEWHYYLWKSGRAECYRVYNYSVKSWDAWGSLYESNPSLYLSYPFTFKEPPGVTCGMVKANNYVSGFEIGGNSGTVARTPIIYVLRPSQAPATVYTILVKAIGKWK